MTQERRVAVFVQGLQRLAEEMGYNTISVDTLQLVVTKYIETYKPTALPSRNDEGVRIRNFSREELVEQFAQVPLFKASPKQSVPKAPSNVIHFPRRK